MARPKKQNKWDVVTDFVAAIIATIVYGMLLGIGFCLAMKIMW